MRARGSRRSVVTNITAAPISPRTGSGMPGEMAVAAVLHRLASAAADRTGDVAAARPLDLEVGRDGELEQREQRGQTARAHPALPLTCWTPLAIAS